MVLVDLPPLPGAGRSRTLLTRSTGRTFLGRSATTPGGLSVASRGAPWSVAAAPPVEPLVKLYFQSLEAKRPTTRKDFFDALAELAYGFNGLRDTYLTMWAQILQREAKQVELAKNVFMWVSYATRPLSIQELQLALAAENPAFAAVGEDALYDQSSITEPCLGLITFSEQGLVGFMHPTAWETFPDYLKDTLTQAQSKCVEHV